MFFLSSFIYLFVLPMKSHCSWVQLRVLITKCSWISILCAHLFSKFVKRTRRYSAVNNCLSVHLISKAASLFYFCASVCLCRRAIPGPSSRRLKKYKYGTASSFTPIKSCVPVRINRIWKHTEWCYWNREVVAETQIQTKVIFFALWLIRGPQHK